MSTLPAMQTGGYADPDVSPIMYITVSGDILGTFRQWAEGRRDTSQTAVTYSAQFFDLVRKRARPGVVLGNATEPREEKVRDMTIAVGPVHEGGSGVMYHAQMVTRSLVNCWQILRRAPTDVIVMDGAGYWFPLALVATRNRRIYLSIHTVLWSGTPSRMRRWALAAEAWFIRRHCAGVLAVSDTIADQVSTLCGADLPPIRVFSPTYIGDDFAKVEPASFDADVFEILFAGRVEEGKGVFDLIDIAKSLRQRGGRPFRITVCGTGTDLDALQARIDAEDLGSLIRCLGHCQREDMIRQMSDASCVVVPTRSSFVEGFNKVVVEAVLAGRPVVTSRVCPALLQVKAAAVEVEPDVALHYADALERLMLDRGLFEQKVAATSTLKQKFLDADQGWLASANAIVA